MVKTSPNRHHSPDSGRQIACPYCDTLHSYIHLSEAHCQAKCRQCGAVLYSSPLNPEEAFVYALTAFLLFIGTHLFPFLSLDLAGNDTTIFIFSTVRILADNGMYPLAFFVFFVILLSPALYLGLILWSVFSLRYGVALKLTRKVLHFISHLTPWNMLEIYLLGVLVAVVKLSSLGNIHFNDGFWLFCALIFFAVLTSSQFSLDNLLHENIEAKTQNRAQ